MKYLSWLLLLLMFALGSALPAQEKTAPRYKGKSLAYWMNRLQKAESDPLQAEAAEAVAAFGAEAQPAIPELILMLDDLSAPFRGLILAILAELGPGAKDAVPKLHAILQRNLKDPIENELDRTVHALCNIGPSAQIALPHIRQAILIQKITRQYDAIEQLHRFGDPALPLLIEFLGDEDLFVMEQAARSLKKMGLSAKASQANLEKMLKDKSPRVRVFAASALWDIAKHTGAIAILADQLTVEDELNYTACSAAEALGEIGPEARQAIPALKRMLQQRENQDDYRNFRDFAKAALRKIEREAPKKMPP